MSCGNGCGCCPKCGCQATCTCNRSLWFDKAMGDEYSYASMKTVAEEIGESGANRGYAAWRSFYVNIGGSSDCGYSSVACAKNGAWARTKGGESGDSAFK